MSFFLSGLALISGASAEADTPTFSLSGSLRYRYATIDDANFAQDATASTFQILLKASVQTGNGFGAVLEGRHVGHIGPDDFNDTLNGQTQFPIEADPEATEIAQGYLSFAREDLSLWAGRRKVSWGNQRFVSALGWRQNERSFDGAGLQASPADTVTLRYQYAFNVNRPQSEDSPVGNFEGHFHFAEANWKPAANHTVTAYAFDHDFDSGFAQALSARTFGVNWTGTASFSAMLKGRAIVEYARQSDIGDNPNSFDHDYLRAEAQISGSGWMIRVGREVLSGDGTSAFRTPFALLHGYNGFADRFLATPANGLADTYVGASFTLPEEAVFEGARLGITYHDFESDNGSVSYGQEWDAVVSVPIRDQVSVQVKTAIYEADGFSSDVTKTWLTLKIGF